MPAKQICLIHGGTTHETDEDFRRELAGSQLNYDRLLYASSWKSWLAEQLTDYDILLPGMPNKQNAKFSDWAVYFDKVMPFLNTEATLIGHSLGGIFLAKYFTEKPPKNKFKEIILVAAPYDDETSEALAEFKLTSASALAAAAEQIYLVYSHDDPVVPMAEMIKYQQDLPDAKTLTFENKGHFNEPTFPELLELLN